MLAVTSSLHAGVRTVASDYKVSNYRPTSCRSPQAASAEHSCRHNHEQADHTWLSSDPPKLLPQEGRISLHKWYVFRLRIVRKGTCAASWYGANV
jgi:hypothetical protein